VKLLVLGHSDSDGTRLANPADGWTWLVQRMVEEQSGVELQTVHRQLFAAPTAVGFMERQLDREQPDVVILGLSSYGVVVQLVSNRVRERYGERAAEFARRQEVRVANLSQKFGGRERRLLTAPRQVARRFIGTGPAFPFENLVRCYEDCFHLLARREQTHIIIFGGLGYSRELQRLNPRLNELQDTLHLRLHVLASALHFDWVTHEEILGGREAKLAYLQSDGVHSNEEGQRRAAEALIPLVIAQL
jgi:lysophospholipase L1-like esterase